LIEGTRSNTEEKRFEGREKGEFLIWAWIEDHSKAALGGLRAPARFFHYHSALAFEG
jgi:hypothetical protein